MCKFYIITQQQIWDPPKVVNTAFFGSCRQTLRKPACLPRCFLVYVELKVNR